MGDLVFFIYVCLLKYLLLSFQDYRKGKEKANKKTRPPFYGGPGPEKTGRKIALDQTTTAWTS